MMAELNLDPVAPLKIEPEKNLLQKAGDFIKDRYSNEIGMVQDFGEMASKPGALKEAFTAKKLKKALLPALMDTLKARAAESYGVVNSATMGAPDAIIGAISRASGSDAYKKLGEFKKSNRLASDSGELGGTVASMLVPGGTGYTKAGQAASKLGLKGAAAGLGKLGSIASGATKLGKGASVLGRVGGAIGKGALLGAEQAIPRGIMEALETGNAGKAAGNAALGVGLGAGLGGAGQLVGEGIKGLGKLGSKFAQTQNVMRKSGDVIGPLQKNLTKYEVQGMYPNLSRANMMRAAKTYGSKLGLSQSGKTGMMINEGDDMIEGLRDFGRETGILAEDDLKDAFQGVGKVFEGAYKKAADTGLTPAKILAPAFQEGGDVAGFAAEYGDDAAGLLKNIEKRVTGAPDIRSAKAGLDKLMRNYRKNPTPGNMAETEAGDLLFALKEKIDDAVLDLDPALAMAKKNWKRIQPLREMVAKEEMGLAELFSGSPTQEKIAIANAGKAIAAGTGDPAVILAEMAGSAIGRKASKGIQNIGGFLRGEIAGKLNNPKTLAALEKGIGKLKGIAGGVGKIGQAAVEVAPRVAGAAPSILSRRTRKAPRRPRATKRHRRPRYRPRKPRRALRLSRPRKPSRKLIPNGPTRSRKTCKAPTSSMTSPLSGSAMTSSWAPSRK
jgi:hypothetical protein